MSMSFNALLWDFHIAHSVIFFSDLLARRPHRYLKALDIDASITALVATYMYYFRMHYVGDAKIEVPCASFSL